MAYRFLYEVSGSLLNDANVVINAVPDAQVVVVRNGHGLGFDQDSKDLTVAAQSLRVLDAIYAWYADLQSVEPLGRHPFFIALHSGQRLGVHDTPKDRMVAAIRRDQPWVERTLPKIGEHDTKIDPGTMVIETLDVPAERVPTSSIGTATGTGVATSTIEILAVDDRAAERINVAGVPHVLLHVIDIAKPEHVYRELFGADIVARGVLDAHDRLDLLPPAQDTEVEAQLGTEPAYAFLRNGPLHIALERMGRGLPLARYRVIEPPVQMAVTRPSLDRIRANVLMRSWQVLDSQADALLFRDPFAFTWAVIVDEGMAPNA